MRKLQIPILAATLIAAAACGGDSGTGPTAPPITGTYALKSVNSSPLPFVLLDDATGKVDLLADSYSLTADGKYTSVTKVRITPPGEAATELSFDSNGTFTKSGSSITLTDAADPTNVVTGTADGSTLTLSPTGFVLVYQRSGS